jgi:uncharacterized protein YodC (DUF2158 family)
MADIFKVGDLVVLKSGGPTMTVESIGQGRVECVWFIDNELKRSSFDGALLNVAAKPFVGVVSVGRSKFRQQLDEFY